MFGWVGVQGQINVAKSLKTPSLVTSPTENYKPNSENFILIETRRRPESVVILNSCLALAAGDLWPKKRRPSQWPARALKGLHRSTFRKKDRAKLFAMKSSANTMVRAV